MQARSRQSVVPVLTLAIVLAVSATAGAAVRYAAPNGDGPGGACKQANPCDIQVAVEHPSVEDGDEIVVKPGAYNIGANEITVTNDVFLHGRRGNPASITADPTGVDDRGVVRTDSPGADAITARIEDLVLIGVASTRGALFTFGDTPRISRVTAIATEALVATCFPPETPGYLRDSACINQSQGRAIGATIGGAGAVTDTFNLVNVTAAATGTFSTSHAIDFVAQGAHGITITGVNVIATGGTTAGAFDIRGEEDGTGPVTMTFTNSNFDESVGETGATVSAPGSPTNQTLAPIFLNPAAGDYRQVPVSPTVNAGDAGASLLGKFDVEGDPRIFGPAPDIGFDEYDGVATAKARKRQKPSKLRVRLTCGVIDCNTKFSGSARAKAGSRQAQAKVNRATVAQDGTTTKVVKLKLRQAGELLDVLEEGSGNVTIQFRAEDGGGNETKGKLKVRLKRP